MQGGRLRSPPSLVRDSCGDGSSAFLPGPLHVGDGLDGACRIDAWVFVSARSISSSLAAYLDVGHELKWITRSGKDVGVVLRDYRNYVHPEKERAHAVVLGLRTQACFGR